MNNTKLLELRDNCLKGLQNVKSQWTHYTTKDSRKRQNLIKALNIFYKSQKDESFDLHSFGRVYKVVNNARYKHSPRSSYADQMPELLETVKEVNNLIDNLNELRDKFHSAMLHLDAPYVKQSIINISQAFIQIDSLRTYLSQWDHKMSTGQRLIESHRQVSSNHVRKATLDKTAKLKELSYFVGSTLNEVITQAEFAAEKLNEIVETLTLNISSPRGKGKNIFGVPDPLSTTVPTYIDPFPGGTTMTGALVNGLSNPNLSNPPPIPSAMETLITSIKSEMRKEFDSRLTLLEQKVRDSESYTWQLIDDKMAQGMEVERLEQVIHQLDTKFTKQLNETTLDNTDNRRVTDQQLQDLHQKVTQLQEEKEKLDNRQRIAQADTETIWEDTKDMKNIIEKEFKGVKKDQTNHESNIRRIESKYNDLQVDLESTWGECQQAIERNTEMMKQVERRLFTLVDETVLLEKKQNQMQLSIDEIVADSEVTRHVLQDQMDATTHVQNVRTEQIQIRQSLREICLQREYKRVNEDSEWQERFVRFAAKQLSSSGELMQKLAQIRMLDLSRSGTQYGKALELLRQWAMQRGGYLPLEELIDQILDTSVHDSDKATRIAKALVTEMRFRVNDIKQSRR